jgi:hypothetical protein
MEVEKKDCQHPDRFVFIGNGQEWERFRNGETEGMEHLYVCPICELLKQEKNMEEKNGYES